MHQFGGNFEEIEEREINRMAKTNQNRCVITSVSLPLWMMNYIEENNLSPSKLLKEAVLAYKDEHNSYYQVDGSGESGLKGAIDRLDMAVESRFQEVEARITKLEK